MSKAEFEDMIRKNEFIEYAQFSGNYYGTSFAAVEQIARQNKICILDVEIQGARNVRKSHLNAAFCWVSTPSIEELERRLRARGTENEDSLKARIITARKDSEALKLEKNLFDCYIVNDDVERAYNEFKQFIQNANSNTA